MTGFRTADAAADYRSAVFARPELRRFLIYMMV